MKRVALLTAGFGDGHHQVAQALREAFELRGVETRIFDLYRKADAKTGQMSERIYEWTTRYTPLVYGASYRLTADLGPDHVFWRILSARSAHRLLGNVSAYQPHAILQLFPDHGLRYLSTDASKRPFIGTILTDFSVHGRWFHRNVDAYYVPHSFLLNEIEPFVDERAEVVVSGIPLRGQFAEVSQQCGDVAQTPYILLSTGGRGLFPELEATLFQLRHLWPDSHLYVMCGRNTLMRRAVRKLGWSDPHIHALPFITNVASWYRQAQFAVVKSGGLTVSECLATGCPMLIYKQQPGQEADNAEFMVRLGTAKVAADLDALAGVLKEMSGESVLDTMKAACFQAARQNAADIVVNHVLERIR